MYHTNTLNVLCGEHIILCLVLLQQTDLENSYAYLAKKQNKRETNERDKDGKVRKNQKKADNEGRNTERV